MHHRILNHVDATQTGLSLSDLFIQLLTRHHMILCLIGIESRDHLELCTDLAGCTIRLASYVT